MGAQCRGKEYQCMGSVLTRSRRVPRHRPEGATLTRVTQGLGRVLVVDDDEVIRRLIAVNLQLEGFEVETAVDGQDCLDKARGATVGADAYLTKPFDPNEMIRVVRELAAV